MTITVSDFAITDPDSNTTLGWDASAQDIFQWNGSSLVTKLSLTSLLATAAQGTKADTALQVQQNSDWNASTGVTAIVNKPSLSAVALSGSYNDLLSKPSLSTVATTGAYNDLSGKPSLATVATTGSYNDLTNKPTLSKTFANPTRTLNSAFQISSTRDSMVSYSVDISASLTLTGGATGTVYLEYADDSGFTTNVVTVNSTANGNTGALTIGLSLTQTSSATLTGMIPSAKYVRIRTANTSGSPSFIYRSSQEVLI